MKNNRVIIIDALRGFALAGIVLIHSIEHFDFFYPPEMNFFFSPETDRLIMELGFLFVGGKAYSIFAMMFGLSFFIQMDRQKTLGFDFSGKFIWRLTILFFFGFIHSLFYEGDILHIYALFGFTLVLFNKLSNKTLTFLAVLFALQIPLLINIVLSLLDPNFVYSETFGQSFWGEGSLAFSSGNLLEVISFNIVKGRSAVWGWMFYNGRYLQLIALFITGLLIGRHRIFENLKENSTLLKKSLLGGVIVVTIMFLVTIIIENYNFNETQLNLMHKVIRSYYDLSFTIIIVSMFSLIYLKLKYLSIFNYFANYGRMSLTNYVAQSIIGVSIFYYFGLGMFRYMGSTWSLIYGICFLTLQLLFSTYWINNYYYGPLEWFWRALTNRDFSIKLKK